VLGRDPWAERDLLMRDVCFIAELRSCRAGCGFRRALDYVAGVHPRFDRAKAEGLLAKPRLNIPARSANYRRAWWRNCISLW